MPASKGDTVRTLVVLVLLLVAPTAATADPAQRCAAAKLKAVAKFERALFDCFADAAARGSEPELSCIVAARELGLERVAAANLLGPCPGIATRIVTTSCLPPLPGGDPACHAGKFRAA